MIRNISITKTTFAWIMFLLVLAGCQGGMDSLFPKEKQPLPDKLVKAMKAKGMTSHSPILVRIFKQEDALEIWKQKNNGRYALLETYEICKWSGKLGPKFKEGDRQAPEGFYNVAPGQMNPKSSYHLSFNIGYPNTFDRSNDRTGTHLMVHGACSSAGCYSMTDEQVSEIYSLARDSFKGGQENFQIQAFPFRMTPENMVLNENNEHFEFWKTLKKGNDYFEITKFPPKVDVCEKNYVFNREVEEGVRFRSKATCPQSTVPARLESAYLKKVQAEKLEMAAIREKIKRKAAMEKLLGKGETVQMPDDKDMAHSTTTSAKKATSTDKIQPTANIPSPRPASPIEEPPVETKKTGGLLSWLWRR